VTFRIENTCTNNVVFNKLTPVWQGVPATVKLTGVKVGSTTIFTNAAGVGSNTTLTLTASQTLASGTVLLPSLSSIYTFEFNDNFTSDASKDGTTGKFTSVNANITSPTLTTEQLVDGVPIP
jgi:hypothetical protein